MLMKDNKYHRYSKWLLTILFGMAVFLFWKLMYPYALVYQEQYQLFLFDALYITERITLPGGAAAVLAEFFTQFYNHPTLGAAIQAVILCLIQIMVWKLMKRNLGEWLEGYSLAYAISFVPSVMLLLALGNENILTSFQMSLLLILVAMKFYHGGKYRFIEWLLIIPLLYWITGPLILIYAAYVMLQEMKNRSIVGLFMGLFVIVYAAICIMISGWIVLYPIRRLFVGLFYYRIVDVIPYSLIVLPIIILCIVSLQTSCFRWIATKKVFWITICVWVLMALGSWIALPTCYDAKTYELIEYDYLVRRHQWDAIIEKAEKQHPDLPMSVCATNLALGMKNVLGVRAFQFYQHGTEGLLPVFERDYTSPLLTGEAYYHLGLINTAQRYAFETMEAIPNYNKSGRVVKRLAETNLINGQYEVAKKYLQMLSKTIFYRKWAVEILGLIAEPEKIDSHPVYGRMRQIRLQDDFLFSEVELDKIFGQLFMHNSSNKLAMQYLLTYPLLNRDVDNFMRYLMIVQQKVNYNPPVCQEAIAFAYMQRQQNPPAGLVSESIMQNFKRFAQVYTYAGKNSAQLDAFKGTLWYYLMKK